MSKERNSTSPEQKFFRRIYPGTDSFEKRREPYRQDIVDEDKRLKEFALQTLPNHEGGQIAAKIDTFFQHEGLTPKPTKLLKLREVMTYTRALNDYGFENRDWNLFVLSIIKGDEKNKGLYIPKLGLSIIPLYPTYQQDPFGNAKLTKNVLHEKAHSTNEHNDISFSETNVLTYDYVRLGTSLASNKNGKFIEEGFCEYMATKFVREILQLPNGVWPTDEMRSVDNRPLLPPAYVWPTASGRNEVMLGALAGFGLELIMDKDPRLYPALIDARKSVKGLRAVAQIIENVQPGLYPQLLHLKENADDFEVGLRAIQRAVA